MAGFQQMANAIVGAPGQIMRSTGIYNELVGKNEELIKELVDKNEELEKKNEELKKKKNTINKQKESMATGDELISHYMKGSINLYLRNMEYERSQESKKAMLERIYGKPKEDEQPPEEIPFFKKDNKGGR